MLLLHGFLGSADDWQPLISALRSDCFLIDIDLPGHGASQWHEKDTEGFDYFCHRLEQAILTMEQKEKVSLSRFNFLGYSLGGRLAMAYSTTFPDRVEQLILEGAHPGLVNESEKEIRFQSDLIWSKRFSHEPLAEVLRDWYKQPVFSNLSESQIGALILQRLEGRSEDSAQSLAEVLMTFSLSKQLDYRQAISRLTVPVHYFYGENDQKFGLLGQSLLSENLISSVQPVAGCGHNVHREQPVAMAGLLKQLFRN